jgi:hypothetical protein
MAIVVEDFKPVVRNSLRGFCRVRHPSGLILHEVGIHTANGRCWAAPPAQPMLDSQTGQALRDQDGKIRYQPLVSFTNKNVRDDWSAQVVQAVHAAYPDALGMDTSEAVT